MDKEELIRSLPDRAPRYCPACGARVAEGAKTCIMCGASLEALEETPESAAPQRSGRQLTRKQILILVGVAVVLLIASAVVGWQLATEEVEIPPTPTLTATITLSPSATTTATPTALPTATYTPAPTPTPIPPQSYTVQSGDTLLDIAMAFDMTVDELKAYNGLDSDIIVEGQSLLVPPPTPTAGPPPTTEPGQPTFTPSPYILYTVKSGDALSTIAEEFGVSMEAIRVANNMPAGSTDIQADQVIQIPQFTPTPTPEAVVEFVYDGTQADGNAYAATTLLYPSNGSSFYGSESLVVLQWTSVGILQEGEYYHVELNIAGATEETTYSEYLRSTAWRVPKNLFLDPGIQNRRYSWRISVVRQIDDDGDTPTYEIINPPSETRTFFWEVAEANNN
ncbi:MAG: LysM peptidoglycan-binding domain-containing protein [Anaerolineae bacterium]|nr:LysM peptidoglycan-binding domain-containing protein [Anaerolineae bacterium]